MPPLALQGRDAEPPVLSDSLGPGSALAAPHALAQNFSDVKP